MQLPSTNTPVNKYLLLILILLPIISVAVYIFFMGVNLPLFDQWENVTLLMKQQQSQITFGDLFAQHNEHRPFFPRLIWLTLAGMSRYNITYELWFNFLLVLGIFVFFINRSMGLWSKLGVSIPAWLLPVFSLLVFNLGQRESWLQGFQTVMFLGMACVIIGLFLLAEDQNWLTYAASILLGIVASYSMVNGAFYWPIGLIVLALGTLKPGKTLKIALWILASLLSTGFFLNGWLPATSPDFAYILAHIPEWAIWVLNFLGAPLMTFWYVAWLFGIVSLVLFIAIICHLYQTGQWRPLIPYFAIILFVLLTTLTVSFGRIGFGLRQSTASRYLTISVWYWACLLALLPLLNTRKLYQYAVFAILTVSLSALMLLGGWVGYVRSYQRLLPAYQAVTSGQTPSDEMLLLIYPSPDIARDRLEFLCENRLSACENRP
jgi:hypothetical protein